MINYLSVGALTTAALVLIGCQSTPADRPLAVAPPPVASASATPVPAGGRCALPVYDLAKLSETLSATSRLREEAVAEVVRRNPPLPAYFKTYSSSEDLYALDTLSCAHYQLVPWFYRHEDCCEDLFYLTFAADEQHLLDWQRVASRGADGFWHAESNMQITPSGQLTVTTVAEDREDEGPRYYRDSVVQAFTLTAHGRFMRQRVDSSRTKHTDQKP